MSRTTIDFGIDLGTTNSGIAVLKGITPEIIKNADDQDVTPSAVSFGKNGQQFVGTRAKNSIITKPDDAYVEFKRRMGTDEIYTFKSSGLKKTPEELSAEVLKALRADAATRLEEEIQAAVITVPAAFELHQCDATRKAAELAGLKGSSLLQEPVAAALAYGFQIDSEKAYWLVYDFGGGTFDAAIIKAEEGLINVVHHGGNNFLGGSDIDWAILEKLVIPKLAQNYDLPDLKRGSSKWKQAIALLKRSIEAAKIELTTKERTTLIDCSFEDQSGTMVECEDISLTQADIISVAEPIIRQSTDICLKVLAERNLSASSVQKIILVGGPTKAPYFREILKERIGISIDATMDPLTVVARGAAVFAGTQKLDAKYQRRAQAGEFQIEMLKSNKSVGHELDPLVGGKVVSAGGVEGFTIEFVNTKTQWRSGKIPLRADGAFMMNLLAEKGDRNVFSIELYDSMGTRQKTVPDSLIYTVGAVIEEQPLINSMGIALANNEVEVFFKKGSGLPLKKKSPHSFRTVHALKAGEKGVGVRIPVIEGENDTAADRNRQIGFLEITSDNIRRDLAAGSEIEVTLKINESREILVYVYVPVLDEEYEERLNLGKTTNPNLDKEFAAELARIDKLRETADNADDASGVKKLDKIESSTLVQEIKGCVSAAKGDADAAQKAEKLLLELKIALDEVENTISWPKTVAQARDWLTDLAKLAQQHGTPDQISRSETLNKETEEIISNREHDRLQRKQKQIEDLYFQILFSVPAYWVNQFQRSVDQRSKMSNQAQAEKLINMGQSYLDQNNLDGLKNIVLKLWDLLPKSVVQEASRGFGSGITR